MYRYRNYLFFTVCKIAGEKRLTTAGTSVSHNKMSENQNTLFSAISLKLRIFISVHPGSHGNDMKLTWDI